MFAHFEVFQLHFRYAVRCQIHFQRKIETADCGFE